MWAKPSLRWWSCEPIARHVPQLHGASGHESFARVHAQASLAVLGAAALLTIGMKSGAWWLTGSMRLPV